ncbi:hypothetical protein O6H91_13G014400 [Diphasiastrum complanatum]|uniref:Uncharacterized protein n=1 Tax=Diphasiastrum complanatum TaxID=34168 RepID=A0ACC2BSF2_DIPCM|nr:hypothetical protein O6H91_13G014400 [Diphasiastrum complanatum]
MAHASQNSGTLSASEEYRTLVDKAYSKFARLRDFPPYGRNKWDVYFHKAFQVYTKLWKFQQDNRQKLIETGLKRWEIGEIASHIGQLYYMYYLRTSDSSYLSESFIFYEAILNREYFKDIGKDVALANKQLRFYARFTVICLLLNRREMVRNLTQQFRMLVDDYSRIFQNTQASDFKEWKATVQEIGRFMKADAPCENSRPLRYSTLLDSHPSSFPSIPKLEGKKQLKLQDAILASYYHNEVKFSELTLDNFRMLQCIEWEPSGAFYRPKPADSTSGTVSGQSRLSTVEDIVDPTLPPNPHKYILYRPTVPQLLLVLATACDELSGDGIILLYISASGKLSRGAISRTPSATQSITSSIGSEVTISSNYSNSNQEISSEFDRNSQNQQLVDSTSDQNDLSSVGNLGDSPQNRGMDASHGAKSVNSNSGLWLGSRRSSGFSYLYPSDIIPFTRRPLYIVIDSDNSSVFETTLYPISKVLGGDERGESVVLLLSPVSQPIDDKVSHTQAGGNLFTFFLTAPVLALCRLAGVSATDIQQGTYEQSEKQLSELFQEWAAIFSSLADANEVWTRVLSDPFLRQLTLRFIFARACFGLHKLYHSRYEFSPRCCPSLPDEMLPTSPLVEHGVLQIAQNFGIAKHFLSTGVTRMPITTENGRHR